MGCHSLLQRTFLAQGWNLGLLHCRQILYHLSHQGNPEEEEEEEKIYIYVYMKSKLKQGLMLKLLYFGPPDVKSWLTGKDWGNEEKRVIEDEMAGWHHWFNRHEFEQTQGDSEALGSLARSSSQDCKELDIIYQVNNDSSKLLWRKQFTILKQVFLFHFQSDCWQ